MKDSTFILLCAMALAYTANVNDSQEGRSCHCNPSEAEQICKDNTNNDKVLIAHEHCDKFYKCTNGTPYPSKCPKNLLYDPVKEECEWPYLVECGDRHVLDDDDTSADDEDVSDDSDDNSDSSLNENKGICKCNPKEANTICAEENSDGILVAHENCNQFYKCDHGLPIAFTCPPNTSYNPYKEVCDWTSTVECGDRVQSENGDDGDINNDSASNSTDENQKSSSSSSDESSSSNNSDESSSSNSDESQSSSSNSSDENKSDSEDSNDNDGTCNCNPEEAPAICAGPNSDGVLVAHENCNQFYMCTHGGPVALTCPKNTLYNPQKEICDWAYEVECGDRIIPEPEQDDDNESSGDGEIGGDDSIYDDPSQAPIVCAASGSNGILVVHEYCSQFYQCSGGVPIAISCPTDLLFDILTQKCDWSRNVDCGSRIVPETDDECACNPRNAPALCSREGSDNKMIAHENCDQFYVCVAGAPVSRSCPATLFYNIEKEVCDWPQNVDCAGRETESFSSLNKHLRTHQSFSE